VLIDVRSTVGPLSFGTLGVSGSFQAAIADGVLHPDFVPSGRITIDVTGLNSGNRLYDAELLRRIDARRYPTSSLELRRCEASGPGNRYRLAGELIFHGVTRQAEGTVTVDALSDRRLVVTGEQVFDIRDFAIPSPTMLMLRIFPDVRVRLHAEAELEEAG
jgi:polyisoprenoid-binding protein YceI